MSQPEGVVPAGFQKLYPPFLGSIKSARAQWSIVVVKTPALKFYRDTVKQKPLAHIEGDRTNTELCFDAIYRSSFSKHFETAE